MAKEGLLARLRKKGENTSTEEENLRKELMDLRFKLSTGQLRETHKIKIIKKDLAKIETLKNEDSSIT